MKHVTIVESREDQELLTQKIDLWIIEHEGDILEIIDIEYNNIGSMYMATITYDERND
ncbi:hypothetical protein GOQ27_01290 [Clostridium sp. D2Q-11]|uniref:Sporulation protein Cse60 n=1 Tax=Anaeromonas frigoriresistens TaxID=2683708 RepID=A0A942UPU4_9FIRM|nr:hypothetical protein [Anaeromonas frigoriresistens]MBS4537074.1 hypothetical protein [Anaeromonas frigoriresistens]